MTTTSLTREPLLTRPFLLLAAGDLAYFTAAGVAVYTLPVYATGPIGSDEAGAGLAFGAFAVTALLLRPVAGRLCDRLGRMPLLVGGAIIAALSMVGTAFADDLGTVVALRLLLGVAEAAFFVASMAALVDLAPPSRMGEAVSYNSLGLYLGLTLGPPLGELLVEGPGFTAAWFTAGALGVVTAALVLRIGETGTRAGGGDEPQALVHWPAVPIGIGFFTSVFAMGGFLAFATLHASEVGLRATSLPLLVYGGVVVTCRIAFARVHDRFPPLSMGAAALGTMAAGLLVMATWSTPGGAVLGAAVMGVGITFSTPAFFTAIFATAAPSQRGAASGTASAFLDLGVGGGPLLLGLVATSQGIPWALAIGAGVGAGGAIWTHALATRRRLAVA